jgi:hypothetical protein
MTERERYSLLNPIAFLWVVGTCSVCDRPVSEVRTNAEMNGRTLPDRNAKHEWCDEKARGR